MQSPLILKDFLSVQACDSLIEFWKTSKVIDPVDQADFWKGRSLYPEHDLSGPNPDLKILEIFKQSLTISMDIQAKYWQIPLYIDTVNVVMWNPGKEMNPHVDNQNTDGSSNGMPQRTISQVIYLNDDYEGGEIWFPKINGLSIKPTKGMLISFVSGPEHMHGVKGVKTGTRFTYPTWYTKDAQHKNVWWTKTLDGH